MITFLPYPDFAESARCLDRLRLGKQRLETCQLLRVLLLGKPGDGWFNHPAARMWRGYENALSLYGRAVCREWVKRGYRDTCSDRITELLYDADRPWFAPVPMPSWLGRDDFHAAHRAALLFKSPDWYGKFGWTEEPKMAYVWPV